MSREELMKHYKTVEEALSAGWRFDIKTGLYYNISGNTRA